MKAVFRIERHVPRFDHVAQFGHIAKCLPLFKAFLASPSHPDSNCRSAPPWSWRVCDFTSTERALYNDVKRRLKRELMQGMGPYERPVVQERKSSTPATFEQRRAWASKKMLIPRLGGAGAMLRHYKAACEVSHPLRQRPVSMPQDLAAAVRYVSRKGAAVVQDRATRSAMLAGQAERLAPLHRRLCVLMPPHVAAISGRMNLAFVACCVDAMRHPDRYLVHRFVHRFEVVGDVADSGGLYPSVHASRGLPPRVSTFVRVARV